MAMLRRSHVLKGAAEVCIHQFGRFVWQMKNDRGVRRAFGKVKVLPAREGGDCGVLWKWCSFCGRVGAAHASATDG